MGLITSDFDTAVEHFRRAHGIHHVIAFSGSAIAELPGVDATDELYRAYVDV